MYDFQIMEEAVWANLNWILPLVETYVTGENRVVDSSN